VRATCGRQSSCKCWRTPSRPTPARSSRTVSPWCAVVARLAKARRSCEIRPRYDRRVGSHARGGGTVVAPPTEGPGGRAPAAARRRRDSIRPRAIAELAAKARAGGPPRHAPRGRGASGMERRSQSLLRCAESRPRTSGRTSGRLRSRDRGSCDRSRRHRRDPKRAALRPYPVASRRGLDVELAAVAASFPARAAASTAR
jgi:hypothetical protein